MVERRRRGYARAKENAEAPPASSINLGWVLVVLLLVAIFSVYSGLFKLPSVNSLMTKSNAAVEQPYSQNILASYDVQLLSFTHPVYGFSVKYPVGYAVYSDNYDPLALKLYAYGNGYEPVMIDFTMVNGSFSKSDYPTFISTIPNNDTVHSSDIWSGPAVFGNNSVQVINFSQTSDYLSEPIHLTYAFINCPEYGVMVEAVVPESSSSEQLVVNSVLESFQCP